ncbi:Protein BCL9 [Nymphon striatum]|nr:Protein BCL9 [Nymphon striatum]
MGLRPVVEMCDCPTQYGTSVILFCLKGKMDLEDALVNSDSVLLADICARILRYLTEDSKILISTFEDSLKTVLSEQNSNCALADDNSWSLLSPDQRVVILKWLIDHVLQEKEEDLMEHLDFHHSPDDLRGICAGQDAFNNLYWYLDDLRLYRENCAKKVNKKDWECVCQNLSEWRTLLRQFRKTSNLQEQELHTYLSEELFPLIENQLRSGSDLKKFSTSDCEKLIFKEKKQMDSMLEHNNKVNNNNNLAPNKTENAKINECNGLVLANPGSGDEVSQIPPLVALQQQQEELLANGELADQNPRTAESVVNNTNSDCVANANNSNNNSNKNSPISSVVTPESTPNNNTTSSEFTSNEVKIEPKGIRTSDCASSNGLLTNGNDSILSVESIDGTIKNYEKLPVPNLSNNANIAPISQPSHHAQTIGIGPPSATVQPLASNIINKPTDAQRDAQYMQQNQIFVFTTILANEGAEAVKQGRFSSIIQFHCEQPGTKVFLEKHPLQVEQFSKQNNPTWINFSQPRTGRNVRMNRSIPTSNPMNPYMGSGMHVPINGNVNANWWQFDNNHGSVPGNEMCGGGNCCPSMHHGAAPGNPSMPIMMPDKIESQQEKPMINFQNLPGSAGPGPGPAGNFMPPGCNMNQMMNPMPDHQGQAPGVVQHQGPMPPGAPLHPLINNSNTANAHLEWNKVENQFHEEKKKRNVKGQNSGGQLNQPCQNMIVQSPNVPLDPNTPGALMHGPPPPYPQPSSFLLHQLLYRYQSPHSNVATVSMNSPAASRIPLPSPGSSIPTCTTAAMGSNSMHNTPLNSPSPALNNPRSVGNPTTPGGSSVMNCSSPGLRPQDNMNAPVTPNSNSNQPFGDSSYSRTLQNIVQSQQRQMKEPSLMPVPSPQQIQYINAFEGQELTIQKQPNTSLKEANIMSPANIPSVESGPQYPVASPVSVSHQHGPATPQFCSPSDQSATTNVTPETMGSRYPVNDVSSFHGLSPQNSIEMNPRYAAPSPHSQQHMGNTPSPHSQQHMGNIDSGMPRMHIPNPHNEAMNRFPNNQVMSGPMCGGNIQRFPTHPNHHRMPAMDPMHRFSNPGSGPEQMHRFPNPGSGPEQMHRFPNPGSGPEQMHRFPNPGSGHEPMHRYPGPNFDARFRAPCPSPAEQMQQNPAKFRALANQQVDNNNRFPVPNSNDGMSGHKMRFPASSVSSVIPTTPVQGNSTSLSPHMQSLEKLTASFDMAAPVNKMQPDVAGSPYGNNTNSSIVSSANTSTPQDIAHMSGQKLTHFDPLASNPLASMAEMSTPSGPSSTTMAPSHSQPGMMTNMSPMQFSGAANNSNAQTNISSMQNMQQNMSTSEVMQNSAVMNNQMTQNIGAGPQTVNNTFLNTTMSVQQLNIQNATNMFNPNIQVQQMSAHPPVGGPYVSSTNVTPQRNISPKTMMSNNMNMPGHNPRCIHPNFMPSSRGMVPNSIPAVNMNNPRPQNETRPFNGTNVQVKPTAPNTIQYLPTRPQRTAATNRTPSLEFLNRFANPITNLERKVPTQNLQYFPSVDNNSVNNVMPGQNVGVNMNQMMGQPGNMNGGMPDQIENRQFNPRAHAQPVMIRGPGPQHMMGNEQMYSSGGPMQMMSNEQQNYVHNQMPTQLMSNQMMQSGPGQQTMYMGGKPPVNMMSPEASQHLPPSLGNQQPPIGNTNFNNCPSTTDPNYGARFHNFQQQLYATNPRPTGGPMNNPNMMGAQYYMPK